VNWTFDPVAATGTVRQLADDGDGSVTFDLVQLGLGTLRLTVPAAVPGADRIYESAPVTVFWTDSTRGEIEQVRSP
jgi:hypothetical protein